MDHNNPRCGRGKFLKNWQLEGEGGIICDPRVSYVCLRRKLICQFCPECFRKAVY